MLKTRLPIAIVIPVIALIIGTIGFFENRLVVASTTPKPKVWGIEDCTKCHQNYGHLQDPKYANSTHVSQTALWLAPGGDKIGGGAARKGYSLPYK